MILTGAEAEINITVTNILSSWTLSLLEICDISLADAGNYECIAMNNLSTDQEIFRNEDQNSSLVIVLGMILGTALFPSTL